MSGGYRTGSAPTELAFLIDRLENVDRRLDTLERPSGEQLAQTVKELAALVEGIQETLEEWTSTRYTNAAIDAKVASPGAIAPTSVTATGIGQFDGGIISADVKARTLSVGYDSVYIDASNRMGKSPSARRFKTDIAPAEFDADIVDKLEPVQFRLIGAVEVLGDDAPVEVGFIAEQLDDVGLGQYVTRDEDGTPHGVAYERLTVPLVAAVQALRADIAELRQTVEGGAS